MEYRYLDPERIREEAAYWRFPGVAAAVFTEDHEEYYCTGLRAVDGKEAFNEDTMFTIASCSKSFTSSASCAASIEVKDLEQEAMVNIVSSLKASFPSTARRPVQ